MTERLMSLPAAVARAYGCSSSNDRTAAGGGVTSLLIEAERERQQAPLRHEWVSVLSQLRGIVSKLDNVERIDLSAAYSALRIPPKRRETKTTLQIAEALRACGGWLPLYGPARNGVRHIQGFERLAAAPTPVPLASPIPSATLPASTPTSADTIVVGGTMVDLGSELGKAIALDFTRAAEGIRTMESVSAKYQIDETELQTMRDSPALDRAVREQAELRIRSGAAARELAQKNLPAAQAALREIVDDRNASAGYRTNAAREIREVALGSRDQPGVNGERFSLVIRFGHDAPPVVLESANAKPANPPSAVWPDDRGLPTEENENALDA